MAAADYYVEFRQGKEPKSDWKDKISQFLSQEEILVTKKTKKSEKQVNIGPFIYKLELHEDKIFYMLASANTNSPKPEPVTDTFFQWMGEELSPFAYAVERLEVYTNTGTEEKPKYIPLVKH